jgi:hypothetical protein
MGFEQGAQDFSSNLMQWTRLGLQQQQYDQEDKRFNRRLELERGKNGMGPSYEDDLKKMQADATWPDIPSSVPTSTPGPLGVPQTTFPAGKPVQPMPAATPNAQGGAMGLLQSSMRTPSLGMLPLMRRRY